MDTRYQFENKRPSATKDLLISEKCIEMKQIVQIMEMKKAAHMTEKEYGGEEFQKHCGFAELELGAL